MSPATKSIGGSAVNTSDPAYRSACAAASPGLGIELDAVESRCATRPEPGPTSVVHTIFEATERRPPIRFNVAPQEDDAARSPRFPTGLPPVPLRAHPLDALPHHDPPIPPEHEREFATYLLEQTASRTQVGMAVAAAVFALATLGDLRSMPAAVLAWSVPVRLGLVIPALLLLAWVASDVRRLPWHYPVALAGCLVSGLTIAGIIVHLQLLDYGWTIHRAVLLSFGIYVLSGLRIRPATVVSGLLLVTLSVTELVFGNAEPAAVRGLVSLVGANLLGIAAAREIERSVRSSFTSRLRLRELAERDGLTGLHNRRHLDDHLERVHRQAQRAGSSLALAMIDVDDFKRFNDAEGHVAGDACLRAVAGALADCAQRPFDLVARYGGEEFVVLWYEPEPHSVEALAERCRLAIAELRIPHPNSTVDDWVTASVGATVGRADDHAIETLLETADRALYEAKRSGRDAVVVGRPETPGAPAT